MPDEAGLLFYGNALHQYPKQADSCVAAGSVVVVPMLLLLSCLFALEIVLQT